jgi:hypothetical protein
MASLSGKYDSYHIYQYLVAHFSFDEGHGVTITSTCNGRTFVGSGHPLIIEKRGISYTMSFTDQWVISNVPLDQYYSTTENNILMISLKSVGNLLNDDTMQYEIISGAVNGKVYELIYDNTNNSINQNLISDGSILSSTNGKIIYVPQKTLLE